MDFIQAEVITNYLWFYFFFSLTVALLILTQISRKSYIICCGFYYLFKSKDRKCNKIHPAPIDTINFQNIKSIKSKKLILIRHGESIWNSIFNHDQIFTLSFPFRLIQIFFKEIILFFSSDSYLFDSPLSTIGISQCHELRTFLRSQSTKSANGHFEIDVTENANNNSSNKSSQKIMENCIDIMTNKKSKNSLIVSSPLRRCIETVSLSLFDRLKGNKTEKIHLLSTLQELTRNIDGISLSVNNQELPPISTQMRNWKDINWKEWFDEKIDFSMKDGVKSKYKRGDDRINGFVEWIFKRKNDKYDTIIVSGHSIWFKMFFTMFVNDGIDHEGKWRKIRNGGVVALDLMEYRYKYGGVRYSIDTGSIQVVFKGFEMDEHNKQK